MREEEVGSKLKELPKELWREIGIRLDNEADVQMFRSTCKSWRTLLPSPFPCIFPIKIPPPPPYNQRPTSMDYYIGEHTCYLIHSLETPNPVFLVLESKPDRHGFFPFPLFASGKKMDKNKDWSPPNKLDLNRLRTSFAYKAYYLHLWTDVGVRYNNIWGMGERFYFQKLVLFSYNTNNNINLVAVALLPNGDLAHLIVNVNNPSLMEWKLVNHESTKFDDIIYYGGRLWGVDLNGGAFVMKDDSMTRAAASPMIYNCRILGRKRLVEASGRLYMLFPCRFHSDHTNKIKVYQLIISKKEDEYEWRDIESIGNKAFFVGHGFSFSVEIGPGTGLSFDQIPKARNGNCIFLTGISFTRSSRSDSANHDFPLFEQMLKPSWYETTTGVYSLVDKEFETISPLDCPQIYCYPYVPPPLIKKSKSSNPNQGTSKRICAKRIKYN